MSDHDWHALGAVVSRQLSPARLELHWAAQVVAAAAERLADKRPDDSHTSLSWQPERESLVSEDLNGRRLGLRLRDATLQVVSEDIFVESEFALPGRTLDEAMVWARSSLGVSEPLTRLGYEMPEHALASGEHFSLGLDAPSTELALWYDNAYAALTAVAAREPEASSVRCWPHHFDIATLLVLEKHDDPEKTTLRNPRRGMKSIGVGMTPGDGSYAEPYFYVTPWPYPKDVAALPELPASGIWHTDGWVGAILTGTALTAVRDAGAQEQRVNEFLRQATQACRNLLS